MWPTYPTRVEVCMVFPSCKEVDPNEQPQGADEGTHYTLIECPSWTLMWTKGQTHWGTHSPQLANTLTADTLYECPYTGTIYFGSSPS